MKLSIKAAAITVGLLWSGCILLLGLINLAVPAYGAAFLQAISSIYPGYHNSRTFGDVLVGTAYGLVDGGVGGLISAWLYNILARGSNPPA